MMRLRWNMLDVDELLICALDAFANQFYGVEFYKLAELERVKLLRAMKDSCSERIALGGLAA